MPSTKSQNNLDPNYLVAALDRVPPFVCRMIAIIPGRGGRPTRRLPESQIVKVSGLPRRTIVRLSYSKTWANISLDTASKFAAGCGVNLLSKNPLFYFFRRYTKGDCGYLTRAQKKALERIKTG